MASPSVLKSKNFLSCGKNCLITDFTKRLSCFAVLLYDDI